MQHIHEAGTLLLRIVNDILDFSKVEAGKLELEQVPFRLEDVLSNVLVMVRQAAAAKQLDLVLLDDPIYAYESEGYSWEEVGSDRLLHVRKGEDYASYRYGPQRLGFLSLEAERRPYRVVRTYSSLGALIRSGHSHFVSEGLLVRKGYRPRGDEPSIPYAILCLYRPAPGVEEVLRALRPNAVI